MKDRRRDNRVPDTPRMEKATEENARAIGKTPAWPSAVDSIGVVAECCPAMKRLGDDILTPIEFLTKKQRKRIVVAWIAVSGRLHLAQLVFIDVFRRYPAIQVGVRLCPRHPLFVGTHIILSGPISKAPRGSVA